jgi:hypothetical protein
MPMCSANLIWSVPRSPHCGQVLAGIHAGEAQPVTMRAREPPAADGRAPASRRLAG